MKFFHKSSNGTQYNTTQRINVTGGLLQNNSVGNIGTRWVKNQTTTKYSITVDYQCTLNYQLKKFTQHIFGTGSLTQNRLLLCTVIQNFNFFILSNYGFIKLHYPHVAGVMDEIVLRKLTFVDIFNTTLNLIKPPFVIKSVLIPKKFRKKTKQKYLVKIVYKNENKRLNNAFKQLHYCSNKFSDSKYGVRLYRALTTTFFEWKESYLFKLKTGVFKKFFKI